MRSARFIVGFGLGAITLALAAVITFSAIANSQAATPANLPGAAVEQAATTAPATTAPATTAATSTKTTATDYSDIFFGKLAAKLGVSEEQLNNAFTGSLNETLDQMSKDGQVDPNLIAKLRAVTKGGIKGIVGPFLGSKGAGSNKVEEETNPKKLFLTSLDQLAPLYGYSSRPELLKQMESKSLTELAQAKGLDLSKVKETMLSSFQSQLAADVKSGVITQAQSDDAYKQASSLADQFLSGKPVNSKGGQEVNKGEAIIKKIAGGPAGDAIAQLLGMSRDELQKAIDSGQTVAQVAQSKGVSVQKIKDTGLAAVKTELDNMVKAGELTQAEADQAYQQAPAILDRLINNHI